MENETAKKKKRCLWVREKEEEKCGKVRGGDRDGESYLPKMKQTKYRDPDFSLC